MPLSLTRFLVILSLIVRGVSFASPELSNEEDPGLLPTYLGLMTTGSPKQKEDALTALGNAGKRSEKVLEVLALGLGASQPDDVKLASARAISKIFFADHVSIPSVAKPLIPLLRSLDKELKKAAGDALYCVGYGHQYSNDELNTLREALKNLDMDSYSILFTIPAMDAAMTKAILPTLLEHLDHSDEYVRERVAGTLSEIKSTDALIGRRAIERIKQEKSVRVVPGLLVLLLKSGMNAETEAALFDVLLKPEGEFRRQAAYVIGQLGEKAKGMIPGLLQRAGGSTVDRLSSTRALLYLRPIVPQADAFAVMKDAYQKEKDDAKGIYRIGMLAFADISQADEKAIVDEQLRWAAQTIKASSGELLTLLELLPYAGSNVSSLVPQVLEHYESLNITPGDEGFVEPRSYALQFVLATHPGKDPKNAPFVLFYRKNTFKHFYQFAAAARYTHAFPLTSKAGFHANLDAIMQRVEDPLESDSERARFATLFLEFGQVSKEFLPRLRAVKLTTPKGAESLRFTIEWVERK